MNARITEINNEIAKYIIDLFSKNNMPINELVLQKVAYKIKMNLGQDHPLYEELPYYWYCYGSFSETLRNSFNTLKPTLTPVNNGFLNKNINTNNIAPISVYDYPEIENTVLNLISKGDYVYSSLSEDIYKEYDPLNILHTFKYDIFNPTEYDELKIDGNEYLKSIEYCNLNLPIDDYFNEYCEIFSKFTFNLDFLNDEKLINEKWMILKKPIRNLWFTFVQGLRCQIHDSYYDFNFNQWDTIFKKNLNHLNERIDNLIDEITPLIDFSRYDNINKEGEKFLNLMGNAYWG